MIAATAIASIALFVVALQLSGMFEVANGAMAAIRRAMAHMRDAGLEDDEKEKEMRRASIQMFGAFFSILIRASLALAVGFIPVGIAHWLGWADADRVMEFMARWDVIVLATAVICAGYIAWFYFKPHEAKGFKVNYSSGEQLLHRVAFSSVSIQFTAADMEKAVFSSAYNGATARKPIFITSLPRAGTTLMLEVLHRFPSLAAHTYRDMPFVMAPVLWSRMSGSFRKQAQLSERAHGDGMEIGFDSPEAFEEVLWRAFWPEKYQPSRIGLWNREDGKQEAHDFILDNMKKIIALRRPGRLEDGRYLSKNNGNIARLEILPEMFPDAGILVPFRHPAEQAISMLRQHMNFEDLHQKEPFVRRYMADIGHYEFGGLRRPIGFPDLEERVSGGDPHNVDYWLGYWIAAFEYILSHRDRVLLVSYEETCAHPARALARICERLEIPEEDTLEAAASVFRSPPTPRASGTRFDAKLLRMAEELFEALKQAS